MLKKLNHIKTLVFALGLQLHAQAQSSIVIPNGASMTVPDNAYVCSGTIIINGDLISSGTNVCGAIDSGVIASILEASALNEDGYYKIGDEISVTLRFTRNVNVTGMPKLTLETGSTDRVASYSSGSESLTLTFNYIVQEGDYSSKLQYVSTSALSLNGGSIKDLLDRDALIPLPEPGTTNSLSGNKNISVDGIIPSIGNVIDGLGENDLEFSSSLSELSFNWTGFNDNTSSGIKGFFIGIGSSPGELDVQSYVDVGTNLNHAFTNLNLSNGSTYYAIVKIEDKAGNSAAAVSNGVTIDQFPGPPQVVGYSNSSEDFILPINFSSELTVDFSEPIGLPSVSIASSIGNLNYSFELQDQVQIKYRLLSPIPSYDQITVTIQGITDLAGREGVPKTIVYNTSALGDYNYDNNVDAVDLANFISSWNSNDLTYELGPSTGSVPNLVVTPDGQFDLEDVMGFTRMWHWSRKNTSLGKLLAHYGQELSYDLNGNNLTVDWIEGANVGQFEFEYDPMFISIDQNNQPQNNHLELSHIDSTRGLNSFAFASRSNDQYWLRSFNVNSSSKEMKNIELHYQFYDQEGILLSQGSQSIKIKAIPSEFALHSNYPNPFNPITRIDYDISQESFVTLTIYDILGREVITLINQQLIPGYYSLNWNGQDMFGISVSAGVYFYQIQAREFVKTRKMILLK